MVSIRPVVKWFLNRSRLQPCSVFVCRQTHSSNELILGHPA